MENPSLGNWTYPCSSKWIYSKIASAVTASTLPFCADRDISKAVLLTLFVCAGHWSRPLRYRVDLGLWVLLIC